MERRHFLLGGAALLLGCRQQSEASPTPGGEPSQDFSTPLLAEEQVVPSQPATAPPEPILGINSHLLIDQDLRLIRELGITHVRSTLYTPLWTDHPTYAISAVENTARTAEYGLQLLYVIHNAYGPVFNLRNDPAAARRMTGVMADMVRRLPTVESWQLWNEPEMWVQAPFGAGENPPLSAERVGANYAAWWRDAYQAIKDINPQASVVTGGTAHHAANRWRGFLRGMVGAGIQADAVAVHVYGLWEESRPTLLEAREIVADRAPLWVTECGAAPGPRWSPQYQAEAWRTMIQGNERERLAERLYPYDLQTDPNDPWHGLRNVDGSPRPVLEWLRARAGRG